MAAIDQIVKIQITEDSPSVSQDSFAVPLILGTSTAANFGTAPVKTYFAASDLLTDGFDPASPEHVYASAMFAQDVTPTLFKVAHRATGQTITDALTAALTADGTWYGLVTPGASDADILAAAGWVETNKKLYLAVTQTDAVATSATDDVASQLKSKSLTRTGLVFSKAAYTQGIDAAWLASEITKTPGSSNWAFKTLENISTDTLSPNQQAILIGSPVAAIAGKNANLYQAVAGVNITQMGTTGSGQYFDIVHGLDWLQSRIKTNIYSVLVAQKKVPYTDIGVSQMISAVKSAIDEGAENGMIDANSPITLDVAKVADVPKSQRRGRIAPLIKFSCRQQGALNSVAVQGTVSV